MEFRGLTEGKGVRFEGLHKNHFTLYSRSFTPDRRVGKMPSGARARLTRKQKSGGNEVIASGAKRVTRLPTMIFLQGRPPSAWRISVRNSGIFGIKSLLKSDFVLHTARLATNSQDHWLKPVGTVQTQCRYWLH
jgi:hypothetical protein